MFDEINLFIFTKVSKIFIPQDLRHTSFSLKFRYSEEAIKIRNNLPLNFVITMVFKIKRWDIFFKFLGLPTISEFYASPDTFNFCRKIIVTSKV